MLRVFIFILVGSLFQSLAMNSHAQLQQTAPPLHQITEADGVTNLHGWKREPLPYASNRIVPSFHKGSNARVLTITSSLTAFKPAIVESLRLDGVTNVKIQAEKQLQGSAIESFKSATNLKGSTFKTWIATGTDVSGDVKIAGISFITPSGNDSGVTAEMFVAPTSEFESLGGWVVPVVRYFGLQLNNPHQNMGAHGRAADKIAAEQMASFTREWMQYVTMGKDMAVISTLQTLGMQNGTGIAQ